MYWLGFGFFLVIVVLFGVFRIGGCVCVWFWECLVV